MKGASAQSHLHYVYIHKHTIGDNRPPDLGLRNHLHLHLLRIKVENLLKPCVKRIIHSQLKQPQERKDSILHP